MVADLYDWLMLVHTLAAMVWLGGMVTLIVLATQTLRSGESDVVATFVDIPPQPDEPRGPNPAVAARDSEENDARRGRAGNPLPEQQRPDP